MVGKQCINNAQEIIIPKLKAWWHQKKLDEGGEVESQIESDYRLVGNEGLFQEYLEMVLQFGFITIFVAAFPLAPLFALLNNWVEIRLDAQKFVCDTRRAVAERAESIGFKLLQNLNSHSLNLPTRHLVLHHGGSCQAGRHQQRLPHRLHQ